MDTIKAIKVKAPNEPMELVEIPIHEPNDERISSEENELEHYFRPLFLFRINLFDFFLNRTEIFFKFPKFSG